LTQLDTDILTTADLRDSVSRADEHATPRLSVRPTARASAALQAAGSPSVLVVMGVSGCGKSTTAAAIAESLGWPMLEGDSLHPAANILKMSAGTPLNDEDRDPWLREIGRHVEDWTARGGTGVVTCSSLKRRYRDTIARGSDKVCFVYIQGLQSEIAPRLNRRTGHFMPSTMLDSQFAALEEPAENEIVLYVDVTATCDEIVAAALDVLKGLAD